MSMGSPLASVLHIHTRTTATTMHSASLLSAAVLLAGPALAQIPPNYRPQAAAQLGLSFQDGSVVVNPPGIQLGWNRKTRPLLSKTPCECTRQLTLQTVPVGPQLGFAALPAGLETEEDEGTNATVYGPTHIVICVDPDAPTPANPNRSEILHWIHPNQRIVDSRAIQNPAPFPYTLTNVTQSADIVPYARPMPPASSPPHRCVFDRCPAMDRLETRKADRRPTGT